MSKVALITGASGGIGSALAHKFASQGYTLQLHYHSNHKQALFLKERLTQEFKIPISLYCANLGKTEGVEQLLQELNAPPEIIIHNAGIGQYGLITEISTEEYEQMIQLHLSSPFMLTQRLLPQMISKKWGRIVFITSIWGETGAACESLYSMVKGGLIALTKSLAKELAPSNITVNAVSPGAIQTEMMASFNKEEIDTLLEEIPLGRMGAPAEVAHAVHFLTEAESAYTTGQVLRVNGGWYT